MLQAQYRPFSEVVALLNDSERDRGVGVPQVDFDRQVHNATLREKSIAGFRSRRPSLSPRKTALFRSEATRLKEQLIELQRTGVHVVLIDVPRDHAIHDLPQEVQIRALLHEAFSADSFTWAPEPPNRDWLTEDGTHLIPADALAYAEFLRDQVLR